MGAIINNNANICTDNETLTNLNDIVFLFYYECIDIIISVPNFLNFAHLTKCSMLSIRDVEMITQSFLRH